MDFKSHPIHNKTAFYSMIGFAILVFLSALTLAGIQLAGFEVPLRLIGLILMFTLVINASEVIGKRFTGISELKTLTSQQKMTLIINAVVFVVAVLLLFNISLGFLGGFATGLLFLQGGTILLEAFR